MAHWLCPWVARQQARWVGGPDLSPCLVECVEKSSRVSGRSGSGGEGMLLRGWIGEVVGNAKMRYSWYDGTRMRPARRGRKREYICRVAAFPGCAGAEGTKVVAYESCCTGRLANRLGTSNCRIKVEEGNGGEVANCQQCMMS